MLLDHLQESLSIIKEMAKEAAVSVEKALLMTEVIARKHGQDVASRRSSPEERCIIETELPKLGEDVLQTMSARSIAQTLVDRGLPIRNNVQGVLALISRTRKQLLLTHQAQAAE